MAQASLNYNPYSFAVHEDPSDTYRRLRDEAPVYWNEEMQFWALSRFADVHRALKDFETYSSAGGVALESRHSLDDDDSEFKMLIELDPPRHTALRGLVSRVFTPRRISDMAEQVRAIFNRYIDSVIEQGSAEVIADITGPFAMDVISAMLGVEEADRAMLRDCADRMLIREDDMAVLPETIVEAVAEMVNYFTADLERRSARSQNAEDHGQAGDGGLLSALVDMEVDGEGLSTPELLGFCVLLVMAGHETTAKVVANAVESLSRHPKQRQALTDDPSLIPQAIEEIVRVHTSVAYMHRTLRRDVELHGQRMREGDSVLLLLASANLDEREFGPDASSLDVRRTPGRHVGFGYGIHFCLGAALARLEGRIALEEIHRRIGDYEVDHARKARFHSGNVSGWASLPISFTPGNPLNPPTAA